MGLVSGERLRFQLVRPHAERDGRHGAVSLECREPVEVAFFVGVERHEEVGLDVYQAGEGQERQLVATVSTPLREAVVSLLVRSHPAISAPGTS